MVVASVAKEPMVYLPGCNRVAYDSEGDTIAGHLFLPGRLANKGFVTLVFDPRGLGESEGRRLLEDPFRIIRDVHNSITFLTGLPFVNGHSVFSAGVCMGAGYAPLRSGDGRARQGRGVDHAVSDVPPGLSGAARQRPVPSPRGRGHRPRDACRGGAHALRKPYYMAYGTRGYSPQELRRFFDDVRTPARDKQLRVLDAQHFDIYWKPQLVEQIVEDVAAFLSRYTD